MLRILQQSWCTDAQKEIQGDRQVLNMRNVLIFLALILILCLSTYKEICKAQVNKCTVARWDVTLAERTKGWWKYTDRKCCGPDDFQQVSCLLAAVDYNYKQETQKVIKSIFLSAILCAENWNTAGIFCWFFFKICANVHVCIQNFFQRTGLLLNST